SAPMTSEAIPNAIGSPAPGCGASPAVSADGPMIDLFGRPLVPASRSPSPGKAPASVMHGICGQTYFESSPPSGALSSWVSRCQDRLASIGSTESPLIWKEKHTPAGRSIYRLAPLTLRTGASG